MISNFETNVTGMQNQSMIPIGIETESKDIELKITVNESEMISILNEYPEGKIRDEFALTALRIGLLSLRQAQGLIDSDVVRHEGELLINNFKRDISEHQRFMTDNMGNILKEYFDPNTGRFQERVHNLLQEGGELERFMANYLGNEGSALEKTLNHFLGENSKMLKLFSPDSNEGILQNFNEAINTELTNNRNIIVKEFSLDNRDGALFRLLNELSEKHGELNQGFNDKANIILKEFSLDNSDSALSRLVDRVENAQRTISNEFSLDDESSAFARFQKGLYGHIEAIGSGNRELLIEVKEEVAKLNVRKEEALRGTAQGREFELELYHMINSIKETANDLVDHVGDKIGFIKNSKTGDILIELGEDHVAAGSRIIIEAKNEVGYEEFKARKEIEKARKNRGAEFGVFVYSARTFPEGNEAISRIGNDIFTYWDEADTNSDIIIKAAIMIARALCTMSEGSQRDDIEYDEINRSVRDIEKQINNMVDISKSAKTILNGSEKILEKSEIVKNVLTNQVGKLDELLTHLNSASMHEIDQASTHDEIPF
jgi:hypothetical protein